MRHPLLHIIGLLLGTALFRPAATTVSESRPGPEIESPQWAYVDSAREEISVGRYWHATRILRAHGVDESDVPADVVLLAQAEAGWKNWPAVAKLLRGRPWLTTELNGEGWWLLGRAEEEAARWKDAAAAYQSFLLAAPSQHEHRSSTMARLVRVFSETDKTNQALTVLDAFSQADTALGSWAALDAAETRGATGDTSGVVALLARVRDRAARNAAWRVLPRSRLAAGDTTGAQKAYVAAREGTDHARRSEAATEAGRLLLALGDSASAVSMLTEGLEGGSLRSRARAAASLLAFPDLDLERVLEIAEVLERAADNGPALRAFDRAHRLSLESDAGLSTAVRLSRARLIATVPARHEEALDEFRAIRASSPDPRIGARNLELWTALRRRQGRTGDVSTLRGWLLEEYPASGQAAEVLWQRGSSAQTRGDIATALEVYARLIRAVPEHRRAGEARMRTGQIALGRGRVDEAAEVYEAYLTDFPRGGRWEEASYWAARARLELGDSARTRQLVAEVAREEPVSYYAVMGAELLGESYQVSVPEGEPVHTPLWLTEGLARLDALTAAGLQAGAESEERALVARSRDDRQVLLTLAEALNERGRTVAGINLGWDLRREGAPWDERLLRVAYPFPYRELVIREAREWGLDPIVMAAIIRQESAFKADIRSHAGAVGLMQVMPPTGRELARRHGPSGFQEVNLEAPEVNLHLGAAFFRDMSRRYDGELPLVLSAYNAGPTRATRWRRYPEAADPGRFTERIPFDETRGYVKNVTRNLGLYQLLYGQN